MTITTRKDTVLVSMNMVEMADVGARGGLIHRIHRLIVDDERRAEADGQTRFRHKRLPINYYSHRRNEVHVLRIVCHYWPYFKDLQSNGPWEQQIQQNLVTLGLSGEADRLTQQYSG